MQDTSSINGVTKETLDLSCNLSEYDKSINTISATLCDGLLVLLGMNVKEKIKIFWKSFTKNWLLATSGVYIGLICFLATY